MLLCKFMHIFAANKRTKNGRYKQNTNDSGRDAGGIDHSP